MGEQYLWLDVVLTAAEDLNRDWYHDLNSFSWFRSRLHHVVLDACLLPRWPVDKAILDRMEEINGYIRQYEEKRRASKVRSKNRPAVVPFVEDQHIHRIKIHRLHPPRVVETQEDEG